MTPFKKGTCSIFSFLISFVLIAGCAKQSKEVHINETLSVSGTLIYENDFDQAMDDWRVEQAEGGKVELNNGRLEITDAGGCTIWLRQQIEGPVMIEYDAVVIDNGGPHDRVSDLNCFWMAKDPKNESDFFAGSDERGGKFSNYDSLRLYYTGVGGHFNTKTRFRRYVGNGEKPLLPKHDLSAPEYLLIANKFYKIRIIAYHEYIQYYRNDQLIVDFYDAEPYTSGHFGFRTVNNHMIIDNFKVYKLSQIINK
ncbi:DUF6250 domain-containing protein [Seonamhaeicola sp.]|uniref:DUF6250 domain-containing protein n=1 Tax=Seonamhaeicola sp. TaxID=1912245 RepID=UPI00262BC090|nr:DUF6250 domain-containing protein [Seonamhaeicola sp.]